MTNVPSALLVLLLNSYISQCRRSKIMESITISLPQKRLHALVKFARELLTHGRFLSGRPKYGTGASRRRSLSMRSTFLRGNTPGQTGVRGSRHLKDSSDWNPEVFAHLNNLVGPFTIDIQICLQDKCAVAGLSPLETRSSSFDIALSLSLGEATTLICFLPLL